MKSKVESRSIFRARSERKIAAPLRTPTRITDSPAKSLVICAPSSPTRFAMSCREISTLSSAMAFDNKLGRLIAHAGMDFAKCERAGISLRTPRTFAVSALKGFLPLSTQRRPPSTQRKTFQFYRIEVLRGSFIHESERHQTHLAGTLNFPH